MLVCKGCEEFFNETLMKKEYYPYGNGSASEVFAVCPFCNGTDIHNAKICKNCGEYISEETDGLCIFCHEDIYGKD